MVWDNGVGVTRAMDISAIMSMPFMGNVRRALLVWATFVLSTLAFSARGVEVVSAADNQQSAKTEANGLFGGENFGKEPTYVKSDTLTLKGAERVFAYEGNVEVRQGDMTLTASVVEGSYNERNEIEMLTAHTNVVIVKGPEIRASGEKAIFDNKSQVVTLTENPELQQEGSVLTADVIRVFLAENRSAAEGNVRVKLVKKEDARGGGPAQGSLLNPLVR
jgi:lipopolysaccharide transport protein LptA